MFPDNYGNDTATARQREQSSLRELDNFAMLSLYKIAQMAFLFAHLKIFHYLCTRNESTPWGYVFKGGQLQT